MCVSLIGTINPNIYLSLFQIKQYEKLECPDERRKLAREIYDNFIMKELLAHAHVSFYILMMLV